MSYSIKKWESGQKALKPLKTLGFFVVTFRKKVGKSPKKVGRKFFADF